MQFKDCSHFIIFPFKKTSGTGAVALNADDGSCGGSDGIFICSVSSTYLPRAAAANIRFSVGHISCPYIFRIYFDVSMSHDGIQLYDLHRFSRECKYFLTVLKPSGVKFSVGTLYPAWIFS